MQAIAVTTVHPTLIPAVSIFPGPTQSQFAGARAAPDGNLFAERQKITARRRDFAPGVPTFQAASRSRRRPTARTQSGITRLARSSDFWVIGFTGIARSLTSNGATCRCCCRKRYLRTLLTRVPRDPKASKQSLTRKSLAISKLSRD